MKPILLAELGLIPNPEEICFEIDPKDKCVGHLSAHSFILMQCVSFRDTPDHWVARDPRIVRLTGKHPLNCEAKLNDLYAAGFLTPANLFYVRNHGAVPKVDKEKTESWTLEIHGCVFYSQGGIEAFIMYSLSLHT